jgi:hypothetical protein
MRKQTDAAFLVLTIDQKGPASKGPTEGKCPVVI